LCEHSRVPRPALLLPAIAVALLVSGCGGGGTGEPLAPATAAPPQRAELGWVERHEEEGQAVEYRVDELEVTRDGWSADVAITNDTKTRFALGDAEAATGRSFGLMLFRTGDLRELEQRNQADDLPGLRRARRFDPPLPGVLEPGRTWSGTISAPGSLAAGRYARVVLGTLVPIGDAPPGFPPRLVWITDSAYRLATS
jgi:hypothetical protein